MAGRRYKEAARAIDVDKTYPLEEAVELIVKTATARFEESVELAVNLNVDPRRSDQMVRGVCELPHGTGRAVRVGVFVADEGAEAAREAGAEVVGGEELVQRVEKGEIDFDRCVATPDMMPLVARLGKILGPRGMMPNPKSGTVTKDVAAAVRSVKRGAVEFRLDKGGIIHVGVGKASFEKNKLLENVRALVKALFSAKPSGAKKTTGYIRRASLSTTMGPSVRLETAGLLERSNA